MQLKVFFHSVSDHEESLNFFAHIREPTAAIPNPAISIRRISATRTMASGISYLSFAMATPPSTIQRTNLTNLPVQLPDLLLVFVGERSVLFSARRREIPASPSTLI